MLEQRIPAGSTDHQPPILGITPAGRSYQQADIDGLHAGQMAVAIHAGGVPATWRSLSIDQIRALAEAGLRRLGLDEVQRIDRLVRAANLACAAKDAQHEHTVDVSAEETFLRQVWSSRRAAQVAADLAFRVICQRPQNSRATARRGVEDSGKLQGDRWSTQVRLLAS